MKIAESTFTISRGGNLKIPADILRKMGLTAGDPVRVAYLTDDGTQNLFREFLLTSDSIGSYQEEQRIAIPSELLRQANIPEDADIQILCLDGVLVFTREPVLRQDELAAVLDGMWIANDILSRLPDDRESLLEGLEQAIDRKGGAGTQNECAEKH